MPILLTASSPVEIEAKTDEAGLSPEGRTAALHLFHDLTSRLELAAIDAEAHGGEEWPRHRFWLTRAGDAAGLLDALRAQPGVAEASKAQGADAQGILFVSGTEGGYAGVLAACADGRALRTVTQAIEARLGAAAPG